MIVPHLPNESHNRQHHDCDSDDDSKSKSCSPIGGKYSYDVKNRKKIPAQGVKNLKEPSVGSESNMLKYKMETSMRLQMAD